MNTVYVRYSKLEAERDKTSIFKACCIFLGGCVITLSVLLIISLCMKNTALKALNHEIQNLNASLDTLNEDWIQLWEKSQEAANEVIRLNSLIDIMNLDNNVVVKDVKNRYIINEAAFKIVTDLPEQLDVKQIETEEFALTEDCLVELQNLRMRATAYDLSVESCGKLPSHPAYGITASGKRCEVNRTIASDPKVLPTGSIVYIEFPEEYEYMNGIFRAEDTGSAIKGDKVDIFWGEDITGSKTVHAAASVFGVRDVNVYVIRKGWG